MKRAKVAPFKRDSSPLRLVATALERGPLVRPDAAPRANRLALGGALTASTLVHLAIILGVSFTLPDPNKLKASNTSLEVVLVNSKSATRPVQADALAQANLDGGGNTDEARRAKNPLPVLEQQPGADQSIEAGRRLQELEAKAQQLLAQIKSRQQVEPPAQAPIAQVSAPSAADMVQRSMDIARLEARIHRDLEAYQQRPKRTFIGARAQEYRFASYVDQWREKIERVGTLNYPEEAKAKRIYGTLQMTVAIKADGTVERIEINRSSGHKIFDQAARRIVELAAPFAKFPENIRRDTDIIEITRTWSFTKDQLTSE